MALLVCVYADQRVTGLGVYVPHDQVMFGCFKDGL